MLYFAYGSNMSRSRLQQRVPHARIHASPCRLTGYQLRFHKVGQDDSGKCDAWYSGDPDDCVEGIAFQMDEAGFKCLDRHEGTGYDREYVTIQLPSGEFVEAITYCANITDASLVPYDWYRHHVLQGAVEAGLSKSYIDGIQAVGTSIDQDAERSERELRVYNGQS